MKNSCMIENETLPNSPMSSSEIADFAIASPSAIELRQLYDQELAILTIEDRERILEIWPHLAKFI